MTHDMYRPEAESGAPAPHPEVREVKPPTGLSQCSSRDTPPRASDNEIDDQLLEHLLHIHAYANDHVRFADQKAAFVVTLVSAMLAFLHARNLLPSIAFEFSSLGVIRLSASLGLFVAAALATWVVFPTRKGRIEGLVFWGAISSRTSAELYRSALASLAAGKLTAEVASHIHELSVICSWKYKRLTWAMTAGAVGLFASVLLFLTSKP